MKIRIEDVCLALAIVNAITTGLALLGSIVLMFIFITRVLSAPKYPGVGEEIYDDDRSSQEIYQRVFVSNEAVFNTFFGTFIAVLVLASLISFIFAVLLCNGISKRQPGQVKAYFIYGVITTAMAAHVTAAILFDGRDQQTGLLSLLGCVLQSLFLVLIYKTYTKLGREAMFKNHSRLIES
ncbi:uncharacterized protein LOC133526006 [Cydia pomonella]|uniref:uncharacterized protein LOC133526006 n=1 Tax=Cydia pomonella TaxID=82600 RepID=UPI002ADE1F10|nr:uncharacterized protein LOC133526006 [Cydia pomonella]